ncbi:hypothetical protein BDZ89DRAFT_1136056 [Hymenopellis radicata]|nr:hypothetical protein BDZ89DRAFT_1136056 [Hymenopellis radicata]
MCTPKDLSVCNYTPYQTRRFRKKEKDLTASKRALVGWSEGETSHLTPPGVWPASVSKEFDNIPPHAQGPDFYAPYRELLSSIFPATSGFSIAGHRPLILNFYVYVYEVYLTNQPIFILLLNAETMLFSTSTREGVDSQLRQHMKDLFAKSSVSVLQGACAFGRRLAFYCGDKSAITPPVGTDDPLDTTPVDRWDCDVLNPDGAQRLKALATEIKMRHGIAYI